MVDLKSYLQDGANYQARAVLSYLQVIAKIEESWNKKYHKYDADIDIARWENGREQGYVVMLRSKDYSKQLNIAFFEHRNSDNINAVKWEQTTFNSPTITTAQFGDIYKNKWDVSYKVSYGEVVKMAEWIAEELRLFWIETLPEEKKETPSETN